MRYEFSESGEFSQDHDNPSHAYNGYTDQGCIDYLIPETFSPR
jgi:hypothetical protein